MGQVGSGSVWGRFGKYLPRYVPTVKNTGPIPGRVRRLIRWFGFGLFSCKTSVPRREIWLLIRSEGNEEANGTRKVRKLVGYRLHSTHTFHTPMPVALSPTHTRLWLSCCSRHSLWALLSCSFTHTHTHNTTHTPPKTKNTGEWPNPT
jgi:hypothetical protein